MPWFRPVVTGSLSSIPGQFVVCVVPMVDKVALGEVSLQVLQLPLTGITTPMFHTHSFITKAIESQ